jgi:hypothetical protein
MSPPFRCSLSVFLGIPETPWNPTQPNGHNHSRSWMDPFTSCRRRSLTATKLSLSGKHLFGRIRSRVPVRVRSTKWSVSSASRTWSHGVQVAADAEEIWTPSSSRMY